MGKEQERGSKPYSPPRLITHGDIGAITQASVGSGMMDGGAGGMKTS